MKRMNNKAEQLRNGEASPEILGSKKKEQG